MNLDDIHFHDCTLNHVVEDTLADTLSFEVSYPIDWQKNIFAPRTIQFSAYQNYEVHGISFQGPPTLLEVALVDCTADHQTVRIETNAGYRVLSYRDVELL